MRNATIRVKPFGDDWQVIGVDIAPGAVPEGLSVTVNQSGPDTASFTLRRDARLPWRDLLPFTPIDIEVDGCGRIWGGRINSATPGPDGWAVTARGWQYHLDDDLVKRLYVHQRMSDWQDINGWPGTDRTIYGAYLGASVGSGMSFQVGNGATVPPTTTGGRAGFFLDGGYTGAIARVVIPAWTTTGNSSNIDTFLLEHDTDPSAVIAGNYTSIANWAVASGAFSRTLPTPRRYVSIMTQNSGGTAYTPGGGIFWKTSGIQVFGAAAYESGNGSVLRASDVIKSAAAACPLLSTDVSQVQTSGLVDAGTKGIPHLTTEGGYETPRQVMTRANAYHQWLLGVDADARVFFKPRPLTPMGVTGDWSGDIYRDSGDTGDELYNRVVVNYTGMDGLIAQVVRTSASPLLALGGATRTKILETQATLPLGAAQTMGDAWLSRRSVRPARGTITAQGDGAVRTMDGADVTPAEILRWPGQMIRLMNRWDPDTGGLGRDAEISAVTWDQATDTATITTDSPNDRLETLLSRLAAVQAARPANY